MGYKFIEDDTKPFVADHNGESHLTQGLFTWSEGSDATNGIKAISPKDTNTYNNNDRMGMRLLSNDLNLMFNLDRTIYVSKKGTSTGMIREPGGTAISKINHFDTITNAINDCDYLYPEINSMSFWSSSEFSNLNGLCIMIGAGIYTESVNVIKQLLDLDFPVHILGYGNNVSIDVSLNWDYVMTNNNSKPLLLENIKLNNLNTTVLDAPVNFKNVFINKAWDAGYFNLANCEKFNGDITFTNAKAIFTGTKGWTLYKDDGIGTYIEASEKQYVGESTE